MVIFRLHPTGSVFNQEISNLTAEKIKTTVSPNVVFNVTCDFYCTHSEYVPGILPPEIYGRHQYSIAGLLLTDPRHSLRSLFNTALQVLFF